MNTAGLTAVIFTCIWLLDTLWGLKPSSGVFPPVEYHRIIQNHFSEILPCCKRDQNICYFTKRCTKAPSMSCILQHQVYNIFNCFPPLYSPGYSVLHLPSASFPSHSTWTQYFYSLFSADILLQTFLTYDNIKLFQLFYCHWACVSFYVSLPLNTLWFKERHRTGFCH